tara:strand:- start:242 stop:808 length:567 start_codon:yes stop_codon:yes gene_type:complete
MEQIKLNLGCGSKILSGFVNVDKFDVYKPDIVHDLEKFPYPFEDNSVKEIQLSHVLEHIGQNPDIFNLIIKEFYRICSNGAILDIRVPHPRHDDFLADPTHVRPITILGLTLYDKELNKKWEQTGAANTPMAIIHNVNFKVKTAQYTLDKKYQNLLKEGKIKQDELEDLANKYNNVIKEMKIIWEVIK